MQSRDTKNEQTQKIGGHNSPNQITDAKNDAKEVAKEVANPSCSPLSTVQANSGRLLILPCAAASLRLIYCRHPS